MDSPMSDLGNSVWADCPNPSMDSYANVPSYASVASIRICDTDLKQDSHDADAQSDDEDTPIFPRETIQRSSAETFMRFATFCQLCQRHLQ